MSINHWMMFGTFAEQDYFTYPNKETYKGIVINANMAAYAPGGMAEFLLTKTFNQTYLIDPQTYAFQVQSDIIKTKKGEVKKSIGNLVRKYGDLIQEVAGIRPLTISDFTTSKTDDFIQKCLDFQRSELPNRMKDSENMKYFDKTLDDLRPFALIAPYFLIDEFAMQTWFLKNIELCERSKTQIKTNEKLFAQLVITKSVLENKDQIDNIIKKYNQLELKGIVLWIDDHDERKSGTLLLNNFRSLVTGLNNDGKTEIINLHGGYFSILLGSPSFGNVLRGVAHGPEYGEQRAVVPVGGGIPIAKYYIPDLHSRYNLKDAIRIFQAKNYLVSPQAFFENVCDCPVCRKVIGNNSANFFQFSESTQKVVARKYGSATIDYPSKEAKRLCLMHYLERKTWEYQFIDKASTNDLESNLDSGIKKYQGVLGDTGISHLRTWKEVLFK